MADKALDHQHSATASFQLMRVQDVIRAEKSDIAFDKDWCEGKMPRKRFPLSKAGRRAYAIGSGWRWRFVEFTALGEKFVVRVLVHEGKLRAYAHLARRVGDDCSVLASYEFHPDVVIGWHVHAVCGEIMDAPVGTLAHGGWVKRLPSARSRHRRRTFCKADPPGGLEAGIWRRIMRFFRVEAKGSLV